MQTQTIKPLIPLRTFLKNQIQNFMIGIILVVLALSMGMCGYHYLENIPWVDSFLNASMILSGMGPVTNLVTTAGKIFAGCYALFSGLTFILIMGIIFGPVIQRVFHQFHLNIRHQQL